MKIKKILLPMVAATMLVSLDGCVEEVTPISSITSGQMAATTGAQEKLLNGMVAFTNDLNTWGASGAYAYYLNDWGYPCQMFYRDVLTGDFPIASTANYNYWSPVEQSTELRYTSYYTYNYYYHFVKNCNVLLENTDTIDATSRQYRGCALVFRALCYFDMARLFEYQNTGYEKLDDAAVDVKGQTVPIVSDETTETEMRVNPRAPFYKMYRFILTDLNHAVEYLGGYTRPNGNYPNLSVAYGMMARVWLELGTRFKNSAEDLNTQLQHEGDDDGYDDLGITTAAECYKKAQQYARLAEQGYTPMSRTEWTASNTGFNTATNAWMLYCSMSTIEQEGYYYSNFTGSICTEAAWGMPQYGNSYREIGSWLYGKISNNDWRKLSWISPNDTAKASDSIVATRVSKYNIASWTSKDATTGVITTSDSMLSTYPAYSNLKFRTRDNTDYEKGMLTDLPMMRVEEMYFIDAEATANVDGVAQGATILRNFLNAYRYTDGSYKLSTNNLDSFTDELFIQKRIEFWGEGIVFFDYKRLKKPVLRTQNSNYTDSFGQDSKDGYVCPTMNYYIPDYAKDQNSGIMLNPDCSKWYDLED